MNIYRHTHTQRYTHLCKSRRPCVCLKEFRPAETCSYTHTHTHTDTHTHTHTHTDTHTHCIWVSKRHGIYSQPRGQLVLNWIALALDLWFWRTQARSSA